MTNVIKLFNPRDKPFGALSNNYRHSMRIDGQDWNTVTNFIYANILTTPTYKKIVQNSNTKDVLDTFLQFYQTTIDDTQSIALDEGLRVKFEKPELSDALLSTGTRRIIYVSPNEILGIGESRQGKNLVGRSLEQLRQRLKLSFRRNKREKEVGDKETAIYNSQIAFDALRNAMRDGDDLSKYMGLSIDDIINKYGRTKAMSRAPSKDSILILYRQNNIDPAVIMAVNNPEALVLSLRKRGLRSLRLRQERKMREIVFEMYADYMLERNFPNLAHEKYAEAREQQFTTLTWQQLAILQDRTYDLFIVGMLSRTLSDIIDQRLAGIYIPSEEEVVAAETLDIIYEDTSPISEGIYEEVSGEPVLIYPFGEQGEERYRGFSPIAFTGMLNIDNRNYPTITHYILARLLGILPSIRTVNTAYPLLLVKPEQPVVGPESFYNLDYLTDEYGRRRDFDYAAGLRFFAQKGLEEKFSDRILQDLLLATGNANIVWADFDNGILGTGPKGYNGENFVGKFLVELRTRFREERSEETLSIVTERDISTFLGTDTFMMAWVQMKVSDMCRVINVMKNYLWTKDNIDRLIDAEFTRGILDKVYQPCSHIFGMSEDVTANFPEYFYDLIKVQPGFNRVDKEVVKLIWKRVAVMIYFLVKYMQDSTISNIRTVLASVERLVSKKEQCVGNIKNSIDNCIVSAIINLLHGISAFNTQFAYNTKVTQHDVNTAASIILNKDVSEEISPSSPPRAPSPKTRIPSTQPSGRTYKRPTVRVHKKSLTPSVVTPPKRHSPSKEKEEEEEQQEEEEFGEFGEFGDIESEEEGGEGEIFGYGEGEESDVDDMPASDHLPLVIAALGNLGSVEDPEEIANYIMGAVETIKTYPISNQIRTNRINFFATIR